jgi:ATP-dependent protease HslVU (ClpYQ) peptidase subunit
MLDNKFTLKPKEPPMTIIAAMKENESSILLASDSEVAIGDIRLNYGNKLCRHPSASLAWAIAGDHTIGVDSFTPWLKAFKAPLPDWKTFSDQAIRKLSELNGERRTLIELSHSKPNKNDVCNCLMVGWLDRPDIYELDDRGIITSYWRFGFHALGSGSLHSWVAYKALTSIGLSALPKMRAIMEAVVTTAPNCNQPIYIWRITQDTIVEGLEKGEADANART